MQQFRFAPGDTSKTIDVFLPDSSSTTGAGLSGLVFNTASLAAYYRNTATGTVTAITLATQTVGGAWSSGGFKELDATNAKGMYRLDIPNAVLASAGEGFIHFYGATNLAQTPIQVSVGYVPVNAVQIGGQTQTLNANNLLKVSLNDILATTLTEAAGGRLTGAFKKFFDVAAPTATCLSLPDALPDAAAGLVTTTAFQARTLAAASYATASAVTALTAIFTGITSLAQWLGLIAGKQVGNTTARTELRATGAGSGTYDETTDSQEAIRDYTSPASTALSNVQWTNSLATAMGTLASHDPGSTLAASSEVTGLNVNTRSNLLVPIEIETPDASTLVYKIRLHLYDPVGNMEAPDSTPTVSLTNAAGTDRSSRLSAASNPSTGVYNWDYTATAGDAEEQLVWLFSVVEGAVTRSYPATSYVVEESAYRFSSTDRATLNAAATAAALATLSTKVGTPAGVSVSADVAAVLARTPSAGAIANINTVFDSDFSDAYDTTNNCWNTSVIAWAGSTNLGAEFIGGTTYPAVADGRLRNYMQLLVRKDVAIAADLAATIADINATEGSGGGTWTPTTDSLEALQAEHDATQLVVAANSKLLRADRKIDKTTNPAHWDEVLYEEGTVTELVRRELFDVDGTALDSEETRIGRAIKP